jgi:hypothetical protein
MFNITTISALVLTAIITMTANVQAKEVSIEQLVDNLVAQSTAATIQAIQYKLQSTVLTASNSLSIKTPSMYADKVKIIDLPSEEANTLDLQFEEELNTNDLLSKFAAKEQVE